MTNIYIIKCLFEICFLLCKVEKVVVVVKVIILLDLISA
jgi:hypothetical protein